MYFLAYHPAGFKIANKTSLICATEQNNTELINLLLQYGADVNAMDSTG